MYESAIGKATQGEVCEDLATDLVMLHHLVCHNIFCPGYGRECGRVMDSRKSTLVTLTGRDKSIVICDKCSDTLNKAIKANPAKANGIKITDSRLYKTDGTLKKKPKKKQVVKSNTLTLLLGGKY
jgi:predicted nucleic acid-binding Zn ribbon protein